MDRLEVLKQEISSITNKIVEHRDEADRLDIVRDVLQREIELFEPINLNSDEELPF